MQLNRAKNAKRNILFGLFAKVQAILFPFCIRTIIIHYLGAEYAGVSSLFTSILSVLSVAELGFGSAIIFSMYRPIAEDDVATVYALLNYYKKIYRIVGIVILSVGIMVIPFLDQLVHGDSPAGLELKPLYIIYLGNTVLSYFLFGYLNSLITAYQRQDIISKINIIISFAMYLLQAFILISTKNYYAYIIVMPIFTVLNNIQLYFVTKKMFPKCIGNGEISDSLRSDIKMKMRGLIISKVGGVSRNAFDSIFISMFLGLTEVAIYNNYYYLVNAITSIMTMLLTAINAGIGNSIVVESKEKNYQDLTKFNFLYMWIAGWCTICLLVLYQPFMMIWVGKSLTLPFGIMCLFCLYFYMLKVGDIQSLYITSAGLFWEFRYCAIWQAILNIILNYILGKYFGVSGIVLATVFSLFFVDFLYGNRIVFQHYFQNGRENEYYLYHLKYFSISVVNACITYGVCTLMNALGLVAKMIICVFVPNIIYILIYHREKIYQEAVLWAMKILGINNLIIRKLFKLK